MFDMNIVDNDGIDIGWVLRTNEKAKHTGEKGDNQGGSKSKDKKKGTDGNQGLDLIKNRQGTPSPRSSMLEVKELDAKNPHVITHVEVIGPNRIVKQRRDSKTEGDPGAIHLPNPFGYDLNETEFIRKAEKGGNDTSLRRTQSLSLPSSSQKRKSGFFKNLFRRKSVSSDGGKNGTEGGDVPRRASSVSSGPSSVGISKAPVNNSKDATAKGSKAEGRVESKKEGISVDSSKVNGHENNNCEDYMPLSRVKTESYASSQALDPRLEEFIKYYRDHGFPKFSEIKRNQKPLKTVPTFSVSIDDSLGEHTSRLDKKGRPIPSHPSKSSFPSALKVKVDTLHSVSHDQSHKGAAPSGKFGSFLKRVTSYADDSHSSSHPPSLSSSSASLQMDGDSTSLDSIENDLKSATIPGLENIKPLKRVSFATNTYFNDPPQQICSRNPRKGEVEVKNDGSVVIHRLTPEEKKHIMENSSCGIVVGGSGQLKLINNDHAEKIETVRGDVLVSDDEADEGPAKTLRNLELAAAEAAAEARAINAPLDLQRTITNNEEEVSVNSSVQKVTIDKPMVSRREKSSSTSLSSMMSSDSILTPSEDENDLLPPKNLKIPHDVVYSRCCHLREILPIPATMKQLKKGSTDPIPLLQLRNPKPSKIEVLSFSDFLSVAPVLCLSLDGVSLSVDMLRTILSSISSRGNFEKLSLRNTPLDAGGWKVLCYFVSRCKSLNSLDLTMVPDLPLNVQKPSKSSANSTVVRMVCNMEDRSDMNWSLLSAAVATRGGLEEMYLNGACMSLHQFRTFIDIAWNKTIRLGLAYNKLTKEQCELLSSWFKTSKTTGIDIGYNDLNGKLRPFIDAVMQKVKVGKNVMKYLSLNSTNLIATEGATVDNNDVLSLLSVLCYCDNLKFLDLSNNKGLFPHGISALTSTLPVFVNLVRLNLDSNEIPPMGVVQLAEVLPFCKRLIHVSLLGTQLDFIAANALATAVKNSDSILTLDIDLDNVPDRIKEKISVYTMRNTQKELKHFAPGDTKSKKSSDKLSSIQDQLSSLLTEDISNRHDYHSVASNLLKRIQSMRSKLHQATEELFKLRVNGELSTEGKETLIRFCCIDASLEKGLSLLVKKNSENRGKLQSAPLLRSDSQVSTSSSSAMMYSTEFTKNGRGALLPFHQPSVESYDPADEEVPITDETREVQKEVTSQLKEEGSVLRKTRDLVDGLRDTADKAGKELNTELLKKISENYNGEDIKNLLLNKDISSILRVLDELSKQGVGIDDIFKKKQDDKKASSPPTVPESTSNIVIGVEANLRDSKTDDYSDSDYTTDEDEDEERMDRAYDEVLDSLQHSRSTPGNIET